MRTSEILALRRKPADLSRATIEIAEAVSDARLHGPRCDSAHLIVDAILLTGYLGGATDIQCTHRQSIVWSAFYRQFRRFDPGRNFLGRGPTTRFGSSAGVIWRARETEVLIFRRAKDCRG
jgi:hypothetical protein